MVTAVWRNSKSSPALIDRARHMNLADGYELVIRAAIEAARPDPELRPALRPRGAELAGVLIGSASGR